MLDVALKRNGPCTPLERARVLAARAELAVALGEIDRSLELRTELGRLELSEEDRNRYREELVAADVLERMLA